MESINERIVYLIDTVGQKKADLARTLSISSAAVTQLCKGKINPSNQTIANICRAYDVNEQWLRTGEGSMFVEQTPDERLAQWLEPIVAGRDESIQKQFLNLLMECKDERFWDAVGIFLDTHKEQVIREYEAHKGKE